MKKCFLSPAWQAWWMLVHSDQLAESKVEPNMTILHEVCIKFSMQFSKNELPVHTTSMGCLSLTLTGRANKERERAPDREKRVREMMMTKNQVQFFYKPMSVSLQTGCKRNKALIWNKDPFSVSRIMMHKWGEIGEQTVITIQQCNLWCCQVNKNLPTMSTWKFYLCSNLHIKPKVLPSFARAQEKLVVSTVFSSSSEMTK